MIMSGLFLFDARTASGGISGDRVMSGDKRKWRRKPIGTDAFLYAVDGERIGPCQVKDVSEGGAMLARSNPDELPRQLRSEEHTSELQSLTNLVCRLLLEKKKNNKLIRNTCVSYRSQLSP